MKYSSGNNERPYYCKWCGQPIVFLETWKGTKMPVDQEPVRYVPGGGPEAFITPEGRTDRGRERKDGQAEGYVPHRVTCKNAEVEKEFRERGER